MASLELTVLDRMISEISRLRAISSLKDSERGASEMSEEVESYRLLSVALWTCSSICEEDANQPAIILEGGLVSCAQRFSWLWV